MDLEPFVVTLPHRLGKAEATRRIKAGIESARTRYGAQLKVSEEKWNGDRLSFRAAVLGQTVTGTIDVADDSAQAAVRLSWFWGHMLKPAEELVQKEGAEILSGP